MSEENVEIVRKYLDAINAFMRSELTGEAFEEYLDQQIEVRGIDPGPGAPFDLPQHFRGVAEKMRIWEQYRDAWVDLVLEPLELTEGRDDCVLTLVRQSGRGHGSGIPIEVRFFLVFTIRDGKVCKEELFRHRSDALEAAGLSE